MEKDRDNKANQSFNLTESNWTYNISIKRGFIVSNWNESRWDKSMTKYRYLITVVTGSESRLDQKDRIRMIRNQYWQKSTRISINLHHRIDYRISLLIFVNHSPFAIIRHSADRNVTERTTKKKQSTSDTRMLAHVWHSVFFLFDDISNDLASFSPWPMAFI